jgi:hypothetical protein
LLAFAPPKKLNFGGAGVAEPLAPAPSVGCWVAVVALAGVAGLPKENEGADEDEVALF